MKQPAIDIEWHNSSLWAKWADPRNRTVCTWYWHMLSAYCVLHTAVWGLAVLLGLAWELHPTNLNKAFVFINVFINLAPSCHANYGRCSGNWQCLVNSSEHLPCRIFSTSENVAVILLQNKLHYVDKMLIYKTYTRTQRFENLNCISNVRRHTESRTASGRHLVLDMSGFPLLLPTSPPPHYERVVVACGMVF